MKKNSLKVMATGVIILVFCACHQTQQSASETGGEACNVETNSDPFTITAPTLPPNYTNIDTARNDINRYSMFWASSQSTIAAFQGISRLKAYNLNTRDLLAAHGVDAPPCLLAFHTRGYLGLGYDTSGVLEFKLYILPVAGLSGTMVTTAEAGTDTVFVWQNDPVPGNRYALELNAPCPKTCDPKSRLFTN